MKKTWYAPYIAGAIPGLWAGYLLVAGVRAVYGAPEPWWQVACCLGACTAGGLVSVALFCRPDSIWTRYWVAEGVAHAEHLLSCKTRQMPLDAPFTYRHEG